MVILLGLIFLLDRSTQDQTIKISFIFFQALCHLICIYKVQANFWNFLNQLEKGLNLPGHVSHSEGIRRGLSVWAFGTRGTLRRNPEGSFGVGFRDTWHTPKESGGWLLVWALGTRGELGRHPEGGSRFGATGTRGELGRYPGKVLPVGALGTRGVPGTLPGGTTGWGHSIGQVYQVGHRWAVG